jgi:DNA (cytosine-5)-methyltransferase 3A
MEELNVVSLFDGMSCGQIALNKLGIKKYKYFASEIDKAAIKVAQDNYPNTIQLGDVTKIDFFNFNNKVDLLIAGSPCQDFSLAGKQMGMVTKNNINVTTLDQYLELKNIGFEFDGESYLFWEFVNAKNIINPKYWLLENVAMSEYNENIINNALNVKAIKINSSLVSCQNRPRMYWTNIPNIELPEDKKIYFNSIFQKTLTDDELKDVKIIGKGLNKFNQIKYTTNLFDVSSLPKKLPALLKSQAKKATNSIAFKDCDNYRYLTRTEAEISQTVPIGYTKAATYNESVGMLGNGWTVDVIVHIFSHINFRNE